MAKLSKQEQQELRNDAQRIVTSHLNIGTARRELHRLVQKWGPRVGIVALMPLMAWVAYLFRVDPTAFWRHLWPPASDDSD